jgi:uncharacterized membrane protein
MSDVWELLMFLGSSVCHQLPERSYFLGDVQMPLCARCIGIQLGFLASASFLLSFGKRFWSAIPDRRSVIVLGAVMSLFVVDALLSYSGISPSTNLRRTLSGLSLGVPLPFVLVPLLRSMIQVPRGQNPEENTVLGWLSLPLLYIISAAAILAANESSLLFYPVSVLGVLGVFVFFWVAASVILLMLTEKSRADATCKLAGAAIVAIVSVLALAMAHGVLFPES